MTITFTQVWNRPSTDVPFHNETDLPAAQVIRDVEAAHADCISPSYTRSENGLQVTKTQVHTSMDTLNITRPLYKTVALDYEFLNFTANTGQTQNGYTVSGIPDPFTVTTVYTFPAGTDVQFLEDALANPGSMTLQQGAIQKTDTTLTVVHRYANDTEWNRKRWIDFRMTATFHDLGITRNETWEPATA